MPAAPDIAQAPLGRDVLPQVWVFAQLQRAIGKLNVDRRSALSGSSVG
jgi:hypothetical protein